MKRRKIKWKNIIITSLFLVCFISFIISLYYVSMLVIEKIKIKNLVDDINNLITITENDLVVEDDILLPEADYLEKVNYYYDYLKVPFMEVDFSKLKEINNEVSGFIHVVGASINYPYVKTNNNDYYLYYSFDKTKNSSGWIFLDYRNKSDLSDLNSIIYAHGGNRTAMFGPLKNLYDKNDWFKNSDNHYVKISTDKYNLVYKVFSLYVIETTSDYLKINFDDSTSYLKFLNKIKDRSYYDFETEVLETDKIITLSTCYNKKEKLVLHAKLIKKQDR